ncbi:MAG TPA: site-specific DNA-methyltransferase, partial [Sumerlaeia bacterium]|nr:site-specific DNA-methyltransferase [Sumerlaeia bacterium]
DAIAENSKCRTDVGPRSAGTIDSRPAHGGMKRKEIERTTRNRRSVWTVATRPYKGAHFATFPPKLIEPCILAGCPVGGTVLDPFGGSGTTGEVAKQNGRDSILIELNPAYVTLAEKRTAQRGLFACQP